MAVCLALHLFVAVCLALSLNLSVCLALWLYVAVCLHCGCMWLFAMHCACIVAVCLVAFTLRLYLSVGRYYSYVVSTTRVVNVIFLRCVYHTCRYGIILALCLQHVWLEATMLVAMQEKKYGIFFRCILLSVLRMDRVRNQEVRMRAGIEIVDQIREYWNSR